MATLIENANRIKNATDDIRAWMIEQGATPSGNIETFRSALDGIEIPKVASGSITSNNGAFTINCGFKPKYICVTCGTVKGLVASVDTSVYVEGAQHPYVSYYRSSANSLAQETDANAQARFSSINNEGFSYKSRLNTVNNTYHYFAIG